MYAEGVVLAMRYGFSSLHRLEHQNCMLKLDYSKYHLFINLIDFSVSDSKSKERLKRFSRLHAKFQRVFLHTSL